VNSSVTRRSSPLTGPRPKAPSPWKTRLLQVPRWAWVGLVVGLILVTSSLALLQRQRTQNEPVALFAYELTPAQVRECSTALANWQVSHKPNLEGNNLLVHPEIRIEVLGRLSAKDIPARDFTSTQSVATLTPSRRQQLAQEKAQLEESLNQSLRSLRGIESADVNLAIPEQSFGEENRPTASVVLNLAHGYNLPRTQAFGIARLISGAVPCLRAEDVSVIDPLGVQVNSTEGASESWQLELQKQLDDYLAGKAQKILDRAYGPGRAECAINVELDYSQMEVKRTDAGPGVVSGEQKLMEVYQNEQKSDLPEDLENEKTGKRYEKICEVRKHKNNEAYSWVVHKLPRINKLTCAVLIDNKGQADNALALVRGAIGFDPSRGDEVNVAVVPMPIVSLAAIASPTQVATPAQQPYWPLVMGMLGAVGACLALAVGLLGVRRVRQVEMQVQCAPMAEQQALCDLNQPANGALPAPATATRSLVCQLEEKAREHPEKLARFLSTTYLRGN